MEGADDNDPALVTYRRQVEEFQYRVLVDKGWKPWEIGRLTRRQLSDFVFVPRDEHGALVPPKRGLTIPELRAREEPPATEAEHMAQLDAMNEALRGAHPQKQGVTNYDEAAAQVRALWASGEGARRRRVWEEQEEAERIARGIAQRN